MCGHVGVWMCGCVDVRRCGGVDVWARGRVGVWACGLMCVHDISTVFGKKSLQRAFVVWNEENQCGFVFFIVSDSLGQIIDRTKSREKKDYPIVLEMAFRVGPS